jgi:hypothetical protein
MKPNMFYPLIVGMCLMALGSSAKAIIDIAVLKTENKNTEKQLDRIEGKLSSIHTYLTGEK